jgi:hypothetical protein
MRVHNEGGLELDRFLNGGEAREETALVLAMIGDVDNASARRAHKSAYVLACRMHHVGQH